MVSADVYLRRLAGRRAAQAGLRAGGVEPGLRARNDLLRHGGRRALEQVAKDTAARYNGYFTNYFANDDNPEYHRRVTGPQILKAAGDAIDAVVIGVGSGGTITGVAEYLKALNSMIRIVAVEPSE